MKFRKFKYFYQSIPRLLIRPCVVAGRTANLLFGFFFRMVYSYLTNRQFRSLLYGSPALITFLVASYVFASCLLRPAGITTEQYKTAGRKAVLNEQYEVAKLYLQRAVELGLHDAETLFDMAKTAEKTKDYVRMQAIMQQLAPDDHPVHASSHLWKATELLTKKKRTREELKLAIIHLEYVLSLRPQNANAHTLLGELYLQMRLFRDAVPHLNAVVTQRPQLTLSLAKAYKYSGETTKAVSAGEMAEVYFSRRSINFPYDHNARLKWADSLMFLERYQEATQVLNDGIKLEDDERFHFGLARTYIAWADSFELDSDRQRQQKLQLLTAGLHANPNEMLLFDRLMPILSYKDETSQEAEQFLLDTVSTGQALGVCHLLLGSNAFLKKNTPQADFHLEQAIKHMPTAPIVANNLAWYLTFTDSPNLDRALALIEPVITQFPDGHEYHETRGQILLRQGKWEEAISDLEFALPQCLNRPQTHDALSVAYDKIGNALLAKQHRTLCNQLINVLEQTQE